MNEDIYIGEDKELCDKIRKIKKIIYSPQVLIYHKVRNFIPFVLQRFSYGTSIFDLLKNDKKINFNNLQYFAPLFITISYICSVLFSNQNFLYNFNLFFLSILNLIIMYESLKIGKNIKEVLLIFLIININIISFGLGSIGKIFGLKKAIKKIYTLR